MRRLIEEGADIMALTNEGKSPLKLAEEMKCSLVFARALQDSGRYGPDLTPRAKPRLPQDVAKKIIFCFPFVIPLALVYCLRPRVLSFPFLFVFETYARS
jgi:hypothetical protein